MSCPKNGPCSAFVTPLELCCLVTGTRFEDPCISGTNDPVPQEIIDNAIEAASEVLWAATGRQYGTCDVTIRPCLDKCNPCPDGGELPFWSSSSGAFPGWGADWGGFPWYPSLSAEGIWTNVSCPCSDECLCDGICKIPLPYPVCCINEVTVDGEVVPPEEYRVDDFKYLVLLEDSPSVTGACFPSCGTTVDLTYGRPVPALVKLATATLACELIKVCMNQPCQLPQRLQSISRQGVTVGFLDPQSFFAQGLTGIYLVDLAIKKFNPKGLLKQASVHSPDVGKRWTRTNTGIGCE